MNLQEAVRHTCLLVLIFVLYFLGGRMDRRVEKLERSINTTAPEVKQ